MKKAIFSIVLVFITVFSISLLTTACGSRKLPGGPMDATPTATPEPPNNTVTVILSRQVGLEKQPAVGVLVKLRYPDGVTTTEGITENDGKIVLPARVWGECIVEIPKQSVLTYSEQLNYPVLVNDNNEFLEKDLEEGSLSVSLNAGQTITYGAYGGVFIYTIKLTTPAPINYIISAEGLTNYPGVIAEFEKTTLGYNGDTALLILTIPPFTQGTGAPKKISFRIKGMDNQSVPIYTNYTSLMQDWYLDIHPFDNAIYSKSTGNNNAPCYTWYVALATAQPFTIVWAGFDVSILKLKLKSRKFIDDMGTVTNCSDDYLTDDFGVVPTSCNQYAYENTLFNNTDGYTITSVTNGQIIKGITYYEGAEAGGTYNQAKYRNTTGIKMEIEVLINGVYPFTYTSIYRPSPCENMMIP